MHNLIINGEVVSIVLMESQEMRNLSLLRRILEKVIGMQTTHQQGPCSKSLLDA